MTNDEILQAAKEAGYGTAFYSDNNKLFHEEIWGGPMETQKVRSLIKIIEKRTVERCESVLMQLHKKHRRNHNHFHYAALQVAAIRKLGEQE